MKKMTKAMLMTALILGSVQWGGTAVHANELQEFSLDEYVVTAARTETKLVDTPANISVVTAEQIESRHYQDVAEALKDVPGANVLDNGTGTNLKSIYLNGDERVLVLVDGRRVNFEMGVGSGATGFDLNQLPNVDLIERIEVMKGAGGALYGSDAVGGVVNVITKKGDMSYGKVSVAFGTGGAEDLSATYYAKAGKTGIGVSASRNKQDYYKYRDYATDSTKRWPDDSDYENEKVSLEVNQELTDETSLTIGYDFSRMTGMSPDSISNALSGPPYGGSKDVDKETQQLHAKYDWGTKSSNSGYLQIYHNKLDYFLSTQKEEKTTGIDLQQVISTSSTNELVVGASYRESEVMNEGMYKSSEEIDNIAVFLNDTWEFAPTWSLNVGVRYDDHSNSGDETTMSAGLNKKLNDDSHMFFNWSQVFRAPNTDDLYWYEDWGGGYGLFGNPNLKPETGDTWTIGYNGKINEKTEVGINYFESDLKDAIDWYTDDGWAHGYCRNVDKQKKQGMEISAKHQLNDNVALNASYTYLKVENSDAGKGFERDFTRVPNIYRLGVNYSDGKWDGNLWLRAGSGAAVGNKYYLDSRYITLDMVVNYKYSTNLTMFAKCYNLLNEAYAECASVNSGSYNKPAQSRRFLIGAEYSF